MKSSLLKGNRQVLKSCLPHLLVCVVATAYLFAGGYMFLYFEKSEVVYLLNTTKNVTACPRSQSLKDVSPKELSAYSSTMLAFTIVTTIGYGEVVPHTSSGKIFCIFYGIVGIPLTLLAIANVGRFLSTAVNGLFIRLKRRVIKKGSHQSEDQREKSLPTFLLLLLYGVYLFLGALIVRAWDDEKTFLDGVYFSFISLTSIGFGDIVPPEDHVPITMLYVGFGLTLGTMAVDILSEYLRKLHYFGSVVKNSAKATIWFGGKLITVKDLINAVGRYLGAPDYALEDLCNNLDQIVSKAIEERKNATTARFNPVQEVEEYHGSVKPIFLKAACDGEISFIDEEGHTHRQNPVDGIGNSYDKINNV